MRYAAEQGYPVPAIHEVRAGGTEIVMDRIDGPSMMDAMIKQPWTMPRLRPDAGRPARPPPRDPGPGLAAPLLDDGDALLHLDLHPMNVLMAERGPVVIDWTNAARGHRLSDVANTYVLLTCPEFPAPRPVQIAAQPVRRLIATRLRGALPRPGARPAPRGGRRAQDARPQHVAGRGASGCRRWPTGSGAEPPADQRR